MNINKEKSLKNKSTPYDQVENYVKPPRIIREKENENFNTKYESKHIILYDFVAKKTRKNDIDFELDDIESVMGKPKGNFNKNEPRGEREPREPKGERGFDKRDRDFNDGRFIKNI